MTDSAWIGVTANLTAPAYHIHDEVARHHGQGPG
jgi:hypothetical protein